LNQEDEVPNQEEGNPEIVTLGKHVKGQVEIPLKGVGDIPFLTSGESATNAMLKQSFKEIDIPIASVTPLQFKKGSLDAKIIFKDDITPIVVEELPPRYFLFSKKRKVMVKQETYQIAGTSAKKYKILTDGEALEEEEFSDEIARTLGAYATTNQYSVGTLKVRLKQKNPLIRKLQAQIATVEANAKDEANKDLEKANVVDQREIKQLKSDLENMRQSAQIS
jgi:hypothetical protein